MNTTNPTDAELVAAALNGNRESFGTLVQRHQQLVCALAYAKTGSVATSEDIAQEAFLSAWKNLAALRAPGNFRGWLCGTVRNLAAKFHGREKSAVPLSDDLAAGIAPSDEVMSHEEEAMLWAALGQMPESHREPLVLFYRGGQSVREIAEALAISEDAVKQRLSRGRAMLQEAVRRKVETALAHSRPGSAFAVAVLAALPAFVTPAQAASLSLAVAKGAGSVPVAAMLPVLGGPLIGIFGAWFGMRNSLRHAESERERKFVVRVAWGSVATTVAMTAAIFGLVFGGRGMQAEHPGLWIFLMAATVIGFCAILIVFGFRNVRVQQRIRAEERSRLGQDAESAMPGFEYRSRLEFLGLPLVHIRMRSSGVAKGWIAAGHVAIAPLAAFGGVAIGGIAFGGVSLGIFATAGLGLGLISFSGMALGGIAIGGLAAGWIAIGGAAWGWLAALGGLSMAKFYAMGHHVSGLHASDADAKAFFQDSGLWQAAGMIPTYGAAVQIAIGLLFTLGTWWVEKRMGRRKP